MLTLEQITNMVLDSRKNQIYTYGYASPMLIEINPAAYTDICRNSTLADMLMAGFNPETQTIYGHRFEVVHLPDNLEVRIVKVLWQK